MMRGLWGSALAGLLLSGCAYQASPLDAPAVNVVTSYSSKLGGKWLVYVDAAELRENIKPEGVACSFHSFPVDLSGPFPSSVRKTLPNVVNQTEEVEAPVPADRAKTSGARGVINIRGERVRTRLTAVPGFWMASLKADVTLTVSVTVDGPAGRLFGKTFDGNGRGEAEAGVACEGGAKAVAAATEDAQRDVLRRIAEDLANADRLRSAAAR